MTASPSATHPPTASPPTGSPPTASPLTAADLWADLQAVRQRSPLVHGITNFVVMNVTANALLAVGAAPVMAHAREEVRDMVAIAQALVLNIGTLEPVWVEAMPGDARFRSMADATSSFGI